MKLQLAFVAFLIVLAGTLYASDFTENYDPGEQNFTHYCYRVCCLNLDASYVEGPPQQCFGPGATLQAQVQDCVDHCLYDLGAYYENNENPAYVTIDQTDIGEVYVPPAETGPETTVGTTPEQTSEDIQPDEVNEENLGTPLVEEESGGQTAETSPQGYVAPPPQKTGGLCPLGFLLLVPLFFRK